VAVEVTPEEVDFPHAAQLFAVKRHSLLANGTERGETAYAISSLRPGQADEKRLGQLLQGHWGIENRLHYPRDVSFDEDRCRIRNLVGAHVMASLRSIPIAIFSLQLGPKRAGRAPPSMPSMMRFFAHRPASAVHFVCKTPKPKLLRRTE
jgi:predicted transposase YbfD/YdcC